MAAELTIQKILTIAQVCEYLNVVRTSSNNALNGGDISENRARLIYMERVGIQNRYNLNPNDPTLPSTANYLFSILRYQADAQAILNNLTGTPPAITGPSNQSVSVNANAVFSVTVTGTGPFSYQWFDYLGNSIAGAISSSYTFPSAQLTDSGKTFFVKVTNAVGFATSNQATLTVTASILGFLYYSSIDPGPTLQSNSDPFSYQSNFSITHNAPLSVPISSAAANNQYLVIKVPSTESAKTTWFNTNLNSGVIPDVVFQSPVTFGGFTYYYTRNSVSMDPTAPLILS